LNWLNIEFICADITAVYFTDYIL